jgi:hypothetical protein
MNVPAYKGLKTARLDLLNKIDKSNPLLGLEELPLDVKFLNPR